MRARILLWLGILSVSFTLEAAPVPRAALEATVRRAQDNLLGLQRDDHWNLPSYLGAHYVSQYYLMTRWFGREMKGLDVERLRRLVLDEQLPDGSWHAVRDAHADSGELNATIFHYWALKAMGLSPDAAPLARAREFIKGRGGLAKASLLTRTFLALFGNYPWESIPKIPFFLFEESFPLNYKIFAQWVTPHLMPMAYLRERAIVRWVEPELRLPELGAPEEVGASKEVRRHALVRSLVRKLLALQEPRGTWGGYTIATVLTLAVFDDYLPESPRSEKNAIERANEKGFGIIEALYRGNGGEGDYRGITQDGRFWDTALALNALLESGYDRQSLVPVARYLAAAQVKNGGFPFGEDFWTWPDTDDTAETILAFRLLGGFRPSIDSAVGWLESMQNRDGGWGGFAKDNEEHPFIVAMLGELADSADLFDDSSADVTAHVLEALVTAGKTPGTSPVARAAVAYLRKTQDMVNGGWEGRWGVNYLYGAGAAVSALAAAGVPAGDRTIMRACDWIETRQNADGGFGETTLSYSSKRLAGWGRSTPSQTAWALLALIAGGRGRGKTAERAVEYLVESFWKEGKWSDPSVVGTGHPKVVYIVYPSYPYVFPLMALGRYLRLF